MCDQKIELKLRRNDMNESKPIHLFQSHLYNKNNRKKNDKKLACDL